MIIWIMLWYFWLEVEVNCGDCRVIGVWLKLCICLFLDLFKKKKLLDVNCVLYIYIDSINN